MNQKTALISLVVGLVFGFLISGTIGIDFFPTENNNNEVTQEDLLKDEEGFRLAYNLTESIYVPIYGSDVYEMMENNETFVLYIGRDTCPYCQQFVPNLMEAAENLDIDTLYHVDTIDPSNSSFIDDENINYTPTTYIIVDGVVVRSVIGFQTTTEIQQVLSDELA